MWSLRPANQLHFKIYHRGKFYKIGKVILGKHPVPQWKSLTNLLFWVFLFIPTLSHSSMRKCFVGVLSLCGRERGRTAVWGKCRNVDKWKAEVFTKFTNNNHLMNMNGKCHAVPQRGCLLLYDSSQQSHNKAHHRQENYFVNGLIVHSVLTEVDS